MKIKVGITDDHELFRKSLKLLVNAFENMEVVLEASNGIDLLHQITKIDIDVLLLDIQMPKMNGIEACKHLNRIKPDLKILILTHLDKVTTISQVLNLGINGYFTKNANPNDLKNAILQVDGNGFYYEKDLTPIIEYMKRNPLNIPKSQKTVKLSKRQLEIIKLTIQEFSGNEIADLLCISPKTVERHKQILMDKTDSSNFIGVIRFAIVHNLISVYQL